MTCYHPIKTLWNPTQGGKMIFIKSCGDNVTPVDSLKSLGYVETQCNCGQCIGCKSRIANDYATRICYDIEYYAGLYPDLKVSFITLTYDDEHLPYGRLLCPVDVQKFIGNYRKYCQRHRNNEVFRYFVKGEYGSKTARPHYHIMLIGDDCLPNDCDTDDVKAAGAVELFRSHRGLPVMNSPILRHFWKFGKVNALAVVNAGSKSYDKMVAYSTGYSTKLDNPTKYYSIEGKEKVLKELKEDKTWCACSINLGLEFFKKYHSQILSNGGIGRFGSDGKRHVLAVPRSWCDYAKIFYPQEYEDYRQNRIDYATSDECKAESTLQRLRGREGCHLKRFTMRLRPYEVGSPEFLQFEKIVRW